MYAGRKWWLYSNLVLFWTSCLPPIMKACTNRRRMWVSKLRPLITLRCWCWGKFCICQLQSIWYQPSLHIWSFTSLRSTWIVDAYLWRLCKLLWSSTISNNYSAQWWGNLHTSAHGGCNWWVVTKWWVYVRWLQQQHFTRIEWRRAARQYWELSRIGHAENEPWGWKKPWRLGGTGDVNGSASFI